MLSVTTQDRAMMPSIKILLGATTRDFRMCFRTWDSDNPRLFGPEIANGDDEVEDAGMKGWVLGFREAMEEVV